MCRQELTNDRGVDVIRYTQGISIIFFCPSGAEIAGAMLDPLVPFQETATAVSAFTT